MEIVTEEIDHYTRKKYFKNTLTGEEYRRIVGGISWPGIKPGFVVVITEALKEPHNLRVLTESEASSVEGLMTKSLEWREAYHVELFLADIENEPMMELVRQFNESLRKRNMETLYPQKAPYCDNQKGFQFYIHTIKKHVSHEKKALHFGEGSRLPGILMELTPQDVSSSNAQGHPAIVALGYAVAHLDIYQPLPPPNPGIVERQLNRARGYVANLDYQER